MSTLTPAQAAQQDNRKPDGSGRYAEGHRGDPGQFELGTLQIITGRHPDLHLWEGVAIPDPAADQTYIDGTYVPHGDFGTIYSDFMSPLDDHEDKHGDYTLQVDTEYLTDMVGGPLPAGAWVEATQEGAMLHVPWQDQPVGYPARDARQHQGLLQLDGRLKLRDGIREGRLAPWAILGANPDFEDDYQAQAEEAADRMRQHSRVDQAWAGPITLAQQFLVGKSRPKLRGFQMPREVHATMLTDGIRHYERHEEFAATATEEALRAGRDEAELESALTNYPDMAPLARRAIQIQAGTVMDKRETAEKRARAGWKAMKLTLAHLHGDVDAGIEAQQRARYAANKAQNEIHHLEQLSAWERSWPGQPGTCPTMNEATTRQAGL